MKTGYKTQYSRRRKGKTDYRKRKRLLLSRKSRLVVRKSSRYIQVQVVSYSKKGDKVLVSAFSKELSGFGWKHSAKNIPASYLTGYLCGNRAKKENLENAVLDIGLNEPMHGSKLYAALKGAIDAGLSVPGNESAFPAENRLSGAHISSYKKKRKISAETISKDFESTKKKIETGGAEKPKKAKPAKKGGKTKK